MAVNELFDETDTSLTTIPVPLTETVVAPAAVWKFEPVNVIETFEPRVAPAGEIEVKCGVAAVTENGAGLLAPPAVVTVTSCVNTAAFAAIVNVAVNDVGDTRLTLLTVIPVPLTASFVAAALAPKSVPVRLTVTVAPFSALLGV